MEAELPASFPFGAGGANNCRRGSWVWTDILSCSGMKNAVRSSRCDEMPSIRCAHGDLRAGRRHQHGAVARRKIAVEEKLLLVPILRPAGFGIVLRILCEGE